jgi:hypothetical protein
MSGPAAAVAPAGGHDTSSPAGIHPSPPAGHDPSRAATSDMSPRSEHDTSPLDPHDTSRTSASHSSSRRCAWCRKPIPPPARRDAVCCSQRCRQARHRFTRTIGTAQPGGTCRPLRLAYADPPYPGLAGYYRHHPDYAGEVDHAALIARLAGYDGWALSTSAAALPTVLGLCPERVRVAVWVRGERPARSARPLNAWEPVIYHGGRNHAVSPVDARRVDVLIHHNQPRLTDPGRVIGTKPAAVARWMFHLLGAAPGDELHDLFPGSGGIGRAWATYTQPRSA